MEFRKGRKRGSKNKKRNALLVGGALTGAIGTGLYLRGSEKRKVLKNINKIKKDYDGVKGRYPKPQNPKSIQKQIGDEINRVGLTDSRLNAQRAELERIFRGPSGQGKFSSNPGLGLMIEFKRGPDKKKRKRKKRTTELGRNVRTGLAIGVGAGTVTTANRLFQIRRALPGMVNELTEAGMSGGLSENVARRVAQGSLGFGVGLGAAKDMAKLGLIGAGGGAAYALTKRALRKKKRGGRAQNWLADRGIVRK
jgi:hypothetical protein